jgi:Protein of unknown function (DUF664)
VTWTAPDVERSEDYPAHRNESEQEMLRDWLNWHRATLLRKCAGLDAGQLATRPVPPSSLSGTADEVTMIMGRSWPSRASC